MAKVTPQHPVPPFEVLVEFLHALHHLVNSRDQIVPVLRGSTLMKHWFGAAARPAADIDLECFPQPGRDGSGPSPVEHGRRLSMIALINPFRRRDSPILFNEDFTVPSDGVNLWEYDTPGVRCYTGWAWADQGLRGILQIDLAQAGSYDLVGISAEWIELPRAWGKPARPLAYSPEMLLAAKLSWIFRQVRPLEHATSAGRSDHLLFRGEPKDLFDAYLLLTKGHLRPETFQNAMLAVALEDKLDWNQIDVVLEQRLTLADDWLPNWTSFADRHHELVHKHPAEMLLTIMARLRPLFGGVRQHLPFLDTIRADPVDELAYLIYADWLEERGDHRADFLRLFCEFFFDEDRAARAKLASSLPDQPGGWLYHIFGGAERSRDIRKRIEMS